MCDSLCSLQSDRTLFAKSSDRPPGEAQVVEVHAARAAGAALRTQHITLPDTGAAALIGSRPTWTWGLEHGVNEHRLAIGNEQLFTVDDPQLEPDGLTGLDLVRLGLERAQTAADGVEVITALIDQHGQGGIADREAGKAYYSSFLLADPSEAWALETSGRSWAARRVDPDERGVALSNRISLSTDWTAASPDVVAAGDFDRWRRRSSPTAHADRRLAVTRPAAVDAAATFATLAGALRDHAAGVGTAPGRDRGSSVAPWPPAVVDRIGTGVSVCMHLTGVQATTAAMVASLPRDRDRPAQVRVALGSPCTSVFVPTFPFDRTDAGSGPCVGAAPKLADETTWGRFRALRDRVEVARAADPVAAHAELATIRRALAPIEAALWVEADRLDRASAAETAPDVRARWARATWSAVEAGLASLGV